MDVELSPDLQSKLTLLAQQQGRSSTALVAEAVERFVDHDAWFSAQVQLGLEEIRASRTLSHEDVGRRLADRFSRAQ